VRGAGWVEAAVLAAPDDGWVVSPAGGAARASTAADGTVHVYVRCGDPLDETVVRSYCIGAAHMALGWVRSEAITVGDDGVPLDLTVRSFGIVRAVDMPRVEVTIEPSDGEPVACADAAFAAVALAVWRGEAFPPRWPTMRA
jgi:xanthine dehydrogenase small subunit